ncbi:MAG: hypothetical protein IPO92_19220 [Saprospiraceae bacterium]|nr:hypothetical protein [Saprospiraceae bacterium]
MKTLKILMVVSLVIGIFSCKKDSPLDEIIGTWKASKVIFSNCTDPMDNRTLTFSNGCYNDAIQELKICLEAVFKSDNTYSSKTTLTKGSDVSTVIETGTYTITSSNLSVCPQGEPCTDNPYTLSSKTINIKQTDKDAGCTNDLTYVKS